jgi:hypothetical protein
VTVRVGVKSGQIYRLGTALKGREFCSGRNSSGYSTAV